MRNNRRRKKVLINEISLCAKRIRVIRNPLSGKKISPFIEFIALHSVSKVNEFSQYGNLNTYTINLGFKF